MKARYLWIALAVLLLGAIFARIGSVLRARRAPSEAKAEVMLVRAGKVVRADLTERIAFTGTVRPRNEVDLFPKVPGRIEQLTVQVGDKVKAGQVLAVVEHKEIAWQAKAAAAQLAVAKANLDGAKLEYDRTVSLFKSGSVAQAQVDGVKVRHDLAQAQYAQAEAGNGLAQQSLVNATIVAPIGGTVTRRPINLGTQVGPQSIIATIQDLAALKLEAAVDAAAYARLAKGAPAQIAVDALPGQLFPGQLTLLSPSLDAASRRAALEIEVDNASGRLMPNMFARAEVAVGSLPATLAIPKAAVSEGAGAVVVFRLKDGRAEAVTPKLGASDGERVAVLDGLAEGDLVAVSGVGNLADGTPVRIAEAAGSAPTAAAQ